MKRYIAFVLVLMFYAPLTSAQVVGSGPVIGGGSSSSSGAIGGSTGATDDKLLCSDGAGGSTLGVCAVGDLDNLRFDGNTISSTDANGNINLTPNGTGSVLLNGANLIKNNAGNFYFRNAGDTDFVIVEALGIEINASGTTNRLFQVYASGGFESVGMSSGMPLGWSSSATDSGTLDTSLTRKAAATVNLASAFGSTPTAAPPHACDSGADGELYTDTSHALCWCDGTTWTVVSGAGACS